MRCLVGPGAVASLGKGWRGGRAIRGPGGGGKGAGQDFAQGNPSVPGAGFPSRVLGRKIISFMTKSFFRDPAAAASPSSRRFLRILPRVT